MSRPHVLVVEDEVLVRDYLTAALTEAANPYAVTALESGIGAVDVARRLRPACMILDLMLGPGPSGFEVCRDVREDPILQHTGVLVLTGRLPLGDEYKATTDAGADLILHKATAPVEALRSAVARLVQLTAERTQGRVQVGPIVLDPSSGGAWCDGAELDLTDMQYGILLRLARRAGAHEGPHALLKCRKREVTHARLNVLRVQIRGIRKQLGPHASMLNCKRRVGYQLRPEASPRSGQEGHAAP